MAQKARRESSWKHSVDAATQAYQELQDNLEREGISDPAAYGELVQRRQIIEQRLKELDERKKQVDDLNQEADACLQNLLKIRQESDGIPAEISQASPKHGQRVCPDTSRSLRSARDGRK